MTRISFTRALRDLGDAKPAAAPGRETSVALVVACTALAALALALCAAVIFTVGGSGRGAAPRLGAAVTVPVQEPPAMPALPPPQPAVAVQTRPPAATTAAPAPARVDKSVAMLAILRRARGVITLQVEDDAGARASGRDLEAFFHAAGWTVNVNSVTSSGPPRVGLAAALGDTPQDDAIRQAFGGAGIRLAPPPRAAGIVQTPEIFVGADPD